MSAPLTLCERMFIFMLTQCYFVNHQIIKQIQLNKHSFHKCVRWPTDRLTLYHNKVAGAWCGFEWNNLGLRGVHNPFQL